MTVRAADLLVWADRRIAQDQLPALVRRLVFATATVEAISFPSGESVRRPGFDGTLETSSGSPWVPLGGSNWEMGCNQDPRRKAEEDFNTRRASADATRTFVFVTPRRWQSKDEWAAARRAEGLWRDVRAIDADDLELWIERAPAVGLWFGELVGLTGTGIASIDSWWAGWSAQTRHAITTDALFTGREEARRELLRHITARAPIIGVRADSAEEAAAFACAVLLAENDLSRAAVVTGPAGARWVSANPGVEVVVAAAAEVGAALRPSEGVTLIVPSNPSRVGPVDDGPSEVMLPRSLRSDFEQALTALGHDPADAERLARNTGRSWPIYRRIEARNPALAHPSWLDRPAARSLTTLCLVGAWVSDREGDIAVIEQVAGRPYADIERDLRELATGDDSPVIQIRDIWKSVSPIELLHLVGPRITRDELDRFYNVIETLLSEPDPILDLEPDQRWAASMYGKQRSTSGLLIDGLADSLVKLSVLGETIGALSAAAPASRATLLVRRLLSGASREHWLSLANVLRELAEAAPEEFLLQLDAGLRRADRGPIALIKETGGSGAGSGCWHADLLWSLELLAWAPRRLVKVSSILAAMIDVPIAGNWANTPLASLVSLYRPWWPQTAADEKTRLGALDRLLERFPDQGWKLLLELGSGGGSFASPNAHPQWRVDDLGFTRPLARRSANYERTIRRRLIETAADRADRIAELIKALRSFSDDEQATILTLAGAFIGLPDDGEREELRAALRKYLWWENSFNGDNSHGAQAHLNRATSLYDALASANPVARHSWLFAADWIEPPEGSGEFEDGEKIVEGSRKEAVREVLASQGWEGLLALSEISGGSHIVGWTLARIGGPRLEPSWIADRLASIATPWGPGLLRGYLGGLPAEELAGLVDQISALPALAADADLQSELLLLLPSTAATWGRADAALPAARDAYWRRTNPRWGYEPAEADFVIRQLLAAERARTALSLAQLKPKQIDSGLLMQLLLAFASGQEPDGPIPDQWRIGRVLQHLEGDNDVDRSALAGLEFTLFPLLRHGREGTRVLSEELANSPDLFIELLQAAYPPYDPDAPEADGPEAEQVRERASNARWLLRELAVLPGSDRDGKLDPGRFRTWIERVRSRAIELEWADLADDCIGTILAHSPDGDDGHWPHELVREILELPSMQVLHEGFIVGVRNNRGVTSRAYNEGGDQERRLSADYEAKAMAVEVQWPETADALRKLADAYRREAEREDEDARLRIER